MNAMFSQYVIDGVGRDLTPAMILGDNKAPALSEVIVDETVDQVPGLLEVDSSKVEEYLELVRNAARRQFPVPFSAEYTRFRIAESLIDSIWREGNIRLEDLPVTLKWSANPDSIGNMAAFYSSVESAAAYIDDLGLSLRRYSYSDGPLSINVATPFSGAPAVVPGTLRPDSSSWIVYIPFDTSDYRLGGSLLAGQLGLGGGIAPAISDPDYFMDCFELVRELVEDGVAISGVSVGDGGVISALERLCCNNVGALADFSDLMKAADEKNMVRVLFAEVPGVLVQIKDMDFDYLDAECLLQDIAFFPLGHPVPGSGDVRIKASAKSGIQNILESLMQNAEGED